jgi:hypothetical protein
VADRQQAGQLEGEAAHRLPIGRSVAWSWCRLAGRHRLQACARLQPAWLVLAGLDHRQFFRAFSLSIGAASHEATTAPVSGGTGWQIASKRASSKARQRTGCRSGVPWPGRGVGLPAGIGCRRVPGLPPAWLMLAGLNHRQFFRFFVLSIGEAGHEATTAPVSSSAGWRSPASGPGRRRDGTPAADRAGRGLVRVSECSITGSSSGSSSSRSVKPATERRRRQCRAVPGGDRRQAGQGDGEAAHRQPIGRAVAWSVLAVLDHRQFGRVFVLSIGAASHEAMTAPVSSSAGWRSPASGAMATARQRTGSRSGGPWPGQGVGVLDHRQFFRFFVLSIGEAGHEATTAPVSNSAGWRSPASGPGRRRDSTPAADRAGRGLVVVSGGWQAAVAVV